MNHFRDGVHLPAFVVEIIAGRDQGIFAHHGSYPEGAFIKIRCLGPLRILTQRRPDAGKTVIVGASFFAETHATEIGNTEDQPPNIMYAKAIGGGTGSRGGMAFFWNRRPLSKHPAGYR